MTLERVFEIVKENPAFIHKQYSIDGCNIDMFSYMFATYKDFKEYNAFELRGITFVDGKRYWSIPKFFNINETEDLFVDKFKDKKIVDIRNKEDGSLISFIKINDKVIAKSKFSIESDQAKYSHEIYETNNNIKKFVNDMIDSKFHPLFEFVSYKNKIVLDYDCHDLILLQIRDDDGKFLSYKDIKKIADTYNIKYVESYTMTLDDMLHKAETEENIEGWVVRFDNDIMVKIKTKWYFKMHHLITEDASKENKIIEYILDETIDDVLSQLPKNDRLRDRIMQIQEKVFHYIDRNIYNLEKILKEEFDKERKEVVMKYKGHSLFTYIMKFHGKEFNEDKIKEYLINDIRKQTNKLEKAREFLIKI